MSARFVLAMCAVRAAEIFGAWIWLSGQKLEHLGDLIADTARKLGPDLGYADEQRGVRP